MQDFLLPILMKGSPYADRQPLGKMDILRRLKVADIDGFVSKWYRPERMAVVIVGSIDPAAMEARLKASFTRSYPEAAPASLIDNA
jgi:zinc protease